ncbi:hypothetical protein BD289DRAFT_88929 [Coniella lustricola]|uniref:Uncharacterized protein n=1 Tax=Coniella lustricola TaxID=2025994 RepID=A0A2T2ZYK0_9PEZI|nr:hypothetical protein BD289DRAFT_88929 [Coniella lustricola]
MRHELHLVNNTLVIFRGWSHIWEVVKEQETNYGRVFENMFARYDSQTGELGTHHRAILYNLGPLRCLVLVEVDAAIMMPKRHRKPQGWVYKGPPKPPSAREQQHNMTTHRYPRSKGKPSKRLERQPIMASQSATHEQSRTERAMFKSLNDASDLFSSPNFGQRVNVVHKGMGTLSSRTAELVTKVIRRGSTSKKHPQMYFGRTPFLVRGGYHRPTKTFVRGSIARTVNRMRVFQNLNQEALRRLVSILQRLREVTKGTQHKQALLVWTKSSAKAQVFEPRTYQRLPISEYWQKKFWTESTETPVCDSKDASESIT